MITWMQEIAGWGPSSRLLMTAAISAAIHFLPIARLLDSLAG